MGSVRVMRPGGMAIFPGWLGDETTVELVAAQLSFTLFVPEGKNCAAFVPPKRWVNAQRSISPTMDMKSSDA